MLKRLLQKKRFIIPVALLVATIPLLCLALYVKFSLIEDLQQNAIQQRETYAIAAAQILNERLEGEIVYGNAFASRRSLQKAVLSRHQQELETHLKNLIETSHSMSRAYVVAADGTMLATYPPSAEIIGQDFSHRDWYRETSRTGQPYVSEFFLRAVKPHKYIFTITLPIMKGEGNPVGILILEPNENFLLQALNDIRTGGSGAIYVVDKHGVLVFHQLFAVDTRLDYRRVPAVNKVTQQLNGAEQSRNPLTGEDEVTAYQHLARSGWGVVTVQPLREILAPVRRVETGLFIAIGAILLLAGYNAYRWARMLTLAQNATADLLQRTKDLEGANDTLRQQSDQLQSQAEELEMQAEELQTLNEELQSQREELVEQAEELQGRNEDLEQMRQQLAQYNEQLATTVQEQTATLLQEVAEHRRTEQGRRESEGRYQTLVENIHLGITLVDEHMRIKMANAALGDLIDKPVSQVLELPCFAEIENRTTPCPDCPGQLALVTGNPVTRETVGVRADGSTYVWRKIAFPIANADGHCTDFIEVIQDVTDQRLAAEEMKLLEQQLRQAQKMEAIGQLAGGVAHDFNNILTVIDGYGAIMLQDLPPEDPLKEHLDQILAASEKAANLTRSLLAFSRKQVMNQQTADINHIVLNVVKFLNRILGEDIQFTSICSPKPLTVSADIGQIEQVLMNLATNARDAMPKGGRLNIEIDCQELDDGFVKLHGYATPPGQYAVISVADSGCGMDEDTRKKIFDPFFTTKEVGKGTGLGLSVVYGIIKQHNGYINVYSEPGAGTTFRIYLPTCNQAQIGAKLPVFSAPPRGGSETILLAEDDPMVRDLMERILKSFGYRVLLAEDGQVAIDTFAASMDTIDLVLMDVIMPRKNGKDACDEIRHMKPEVKVLYSSGYTAEFIHNQVGLEENTDLIMKPVKPFELIRKVDAMLGR